MTSTDFKAPRWSLLTTTDDQYYEIREKFYQTTDKSKYEVQEIYQLDDEEDKKKYERFKESSIAMGSKPEALESMLFFGGKQKDMREVANGYYQLFPETKEPEYGQGMYFTTSAMESIRRAEQEADGYRYLLYCPVFHGLYCRGRASITLPPNPYDSCCNDEYDPTTFVIFDAHRYLPQNVIVYKKLTASGAPSTKSVRMTATVTPQKNTTTGTTQEQFVIQVEPEVAKEEVKPPPPTKTEAKQEKPKEEKKSTKEEDKAHDKDKKPCCCLGCVALVWRKCHVPILLILYEAVIFGVMFWGLHAIGYY